MSRSFLALKKEGYLIMNGRLPSLMIALSSLILLSILAATVLSQNGNPQDNPANPAKPMEMQTANLPGKAQPKDDSIAAQQVSSQVSSQASSMVVTPQVASNYAF